MARTDPRPNYGQKRRIGAGGYINVWMPGHPMARKDGYAQEHRVVAYEAGLITERSQHVHHINGDKTDNRLENLEAKSASEHTRDHIRETGFIVNQYGRWSLEHEPRHGTKTEYFQWGCRCEPCKAVAREHTRYYAERRKAQS